MKLRVSVIVAFCMLFVAANAFAGYEPEWRGQEGSTYQLWEFKTDTNPDVPNVVDNPYGDPIAEVQDDNPINMWWIGEDRGHEGIWKTEGMAKLDIPNSQNTDPESYKNIVIQMIYDAGPGVDAWIRFSADGSDVSDGIKPVESEDLGDGYRYSRWEIQIRPNPTEETIYALPFYCNLYVDSIEVDTICVPEPATMGLLSLGGLLALRRKK